MVKSSIFEMDGEQVNTLVTQYSKNIAKAMKAKVIKENSSVNAIVTQLKKELDLFKPLLPLILALRNPGMRERHWQLLSKHLPFPFEPAEHMTLTSILEEYQLQQYMEVIVKVGDSSAKEYQIEQSLDKMDNAWKGMEFDIQPYKKTGTFVVKSVDDIVAQLDEHIVTTQAMQFSPYRKVFEDKLNKWAVKLTTVSEVIEEWLAVQRQWMSLQSIFASPDINKQLPVEGKRFASVNKTWRLIMAQVQANPDALNFGDTPGLLIKLQECNQLLQIVQKRLSDYLDKKRAAFARFYFLANEELLAILSQTADPTAVQPHLKKCFENIHRLEFTPIDPAHPNGDLVITAMFSGENERVQFVTPINPKDKSVEFWLSEVENAMKLSLIDSMNRAITDYPTRDRRDWVKSWPGQCVLNGSQLHWTADVEQALITGGNKGLSEYKQKWADQLIQMVELVRGDLTDIQRLILGALIVLDVHARDVLERLVSEGTANVTDFGWIMQMRYYLSEESRATHCTDGPVAIPLRL